MSKWPRWTTSHSRSDVRIGCVTDFDITATGVRSNFNRNRMPFKDNSGHLIQTETDWQRSRNQHRNWETINQVISLRLLPENITLPVRESDDSGTRWSFEFEITTPSSLVYDSNELGLLEKDCVGVPMILNLEESRKMPPYLIPQDNIRFQILDK